MAAFKFSLIKKLKKEVIRESLQKEIRNISQRIDIATANKIGDIAVSVIKDFVSKGINPLNVGGKFPKYSDNYKNVIKSQIAFRKNRGNKTFGIPFFTEVSSLKTKKARKVEIAGLSQYALKVREQDKQKFKDKRISPVNLKLSGKFLEEFESRPKKTATGISIILGFFKSYGKKLETFHRNATNARPIIPINTEPLSAKVRKTILDRILPIIRNRMIRK